MPFRTCAGESQPEAGVPEWLFSAASFLGDAITFKRRTNALRRLADVTVSFDATVDTLGQAAMAAIRECVLYARCVKVFESSEDLSDWAVTDAWVPLSSSSSPLTPTSTSSEESGTTSGVGVGGGATITAAAAGAVSSNVFGAESKRDEGNEMSAILNDPQLIADPFREDLGLGCSDSTIKKTWQPPSSQNLRPQELMELAEQEMRHPGALRVRKRPEMAVRF